MDFVQLCPFFVLFFFFHRTADADQILFKIFSVKPDLKTLEAAFHQVEKRYRLIKKQQFTRETEYIQDIDYSKPCFKIYT